MKTKSYFSILKSAFFPGILLLAIFGLAVNVDAQQSSRVTVLKDFCQSIGASNTCNGIPGTFPSSVTFTVQVGTFDTVTMVFTPVGPASPDIVVSIGGNANGSFTTDPIFTAGTFVRVCEMVPNGWQAIPRPENSGGGQTQFEQNNCLIAQLGREKTRLSFSMARAVRRPRTLRSAAA